MSFHVGRAVLRTGVALLMAAQAGSVCAAQPRAGTGAVLDSLSMGGQALRVRLQVTPRGVGVLRVSNPSGSKDLEIVDPFAILLKDGTAYNLHNLVLIGAASRHRVEPQATPARAAATLPGEQIDVHLRSEDNSLQADWSVVLLHGSSYVRQVLTVTAGTRDVPITRVQLVDLPLRSATISGAVKGSPIVAGNLFLGVEHPITESRVTNGRATAWVDRQLPLRAGQQVTYSSVLGLARPGQMRRDFQAYLEGERAHPYRTFLHYNSWYDLGYFTPYDQAAAMDRVTTFTRELGDKRGVKLDSFLFDDGWDNHRSLWKFNNGFPNGFTPVTAEAKQHGAAPGVWMSPWGGYSKPKQERVEFGRSAGYETIKDGYALSGPKYYAAFRDVCMEMVTKYGVNHFKFDGTGNVDSVVPGSAYDSDFAAAIHLISELRATKPDIFINLTTGTWPSPFWLLYADSIWRGGEDDDFAGVGTYRERWITYRDAQTYSRIVQSGPLFPLNSLMLHGMIYARFRKHLDDDPGNDFRNEIRSYFGTGTQLQEMYITPSLLTTDNWDDLAEAEKWSRANAAVLKDTHWIGGDPTWLQVYGWASWAAANQPNGSAKGIVTLRNPSDRAQFISLKLQDALELPPGSPQAYAAVSPWKQDAQKAPVLLRADQAHAFQLAPFEVLTLEIKPR